MQASGEMGGFAAWGAIREAWTLLIGARRTFLYMSLIVAFVTWLVGDVLLGWVLPPAEPAMITLPSGEMVPQFQNSGTRVDFSVGGPSFGSGAATAYPLIEQIVTFAISALFAGAFAAFALRRAVGLEVRYTMLAGFMRFFPTFLILDLLAFGAMFLLGKLGPLPLLIASIVGLTIFAFVHLFVVDRDAGVGEALDDSYRLASANLGQTILLLLTGAVLTVVVHAPVILTTSFLPTWGTVVFGLITGLVSILLTALMSVALACAFRDTVGIRTAGGEIPMGSGRTDAAPGRIPG